MRIDRYSKLILVNNKTILNFNFKGISTKNVTYKGYDFAYLYAFNPYSSTSKLKQLQIKQTLDLPQISYIKISTKMMVDNFWNCTVSRITVETSNLTGLSNNK